MFSGGSGAGRCWEVRAAAAANLFKSSFQSLCSVERRMEGTLNSIYMNKPVGPIWGSFGDGRMDGRMDGWTGR